MIARFIGEHGFDKSADARISLEEGLQRVRNAEAQLNQRLVNREDVIRVVFQAILTGHHALLLGRTGTAKSLLVNQILDALDGAGSRVFRIKASIDDTKDNYFGPIDVLAYRERGVKVRHTGRSLLEADFAFIDEIFDTNEQVLRDLMLILSDRVLQEGPSTYDAPLRSCVAACNYLRVNDVTEALLDRFLFKIVIPSDHDPFAQLQIDTANAIGSFDTPLPFVDQDFIDRVVRIVRGQSEEQEVRIPTRVLFLKSMVLGAFVARLKKTQPEAYISPRRQARMLELLRLTALLDGRDEVCEGDLYALRSMVGIMGGEQREDEVFERTLRETLRVFEVDPKLKAASELLARAFDLARAPAVRAEDWSGLQRLLSDAAPRDRIKLGARPTYEALYDALDKLQIPFTQLDDLRRGCLELLRRRTRISTATGA